MASFLVPVLLSCSVFSYDVNSINVESVSFDTERIVVNFSNGKYQEIESPVEPEFLDYRYNIIDVNFDGFKDLVVSEINGINSLSFVYLYDSNKNRFNDDVFFNHQV